MHNAQCRFWPIRPGADRVGYAVASNILNTEGGQRFLGALSTEPMARLHRQRVIPAFLTTLSLAPSTATAYHPTA
jgi:hypothetical protein